MGLRARLALLFAAAVSVLALAGGTLVLQQLDAGLDNALDVSLTARADALAQQVGPDGTVANFQDNGGPGSVLPPSETLAQIIGAHGTLVEASEGTKNHLLLTPAQLSAARTGIVTATALLPQGEQVRLLALPAPDSGTPPVVVVVGASRELGASAENQVRTALLIGGPVAALLGGFGAWLVAGAALRPVERMRAQAARISGGDTTARLEVPERRDEIARLGQTMNELLARLQGALAKQRAFVADAGHELRTPLTMLRAELELAARPGRDRASLVAAIQAAAVDTDRLIRLAEDLLTLARADDSRLALRREPVALDTLVTKAVKAATAASQARRVRLLTDLRATRVVGDADRLRQVVDNIMDNALRHSPDDGTITVTLVSRAPRVALLTVQDQGPGFPAEFLAHAFDRFARADPARSDAAGTGLGLAIVAALVAAHGGQVRAGNRLPGGAVIEISLPAAQER